MNPGQVITNIYDQMLDFLSSKSGVLVQDGHDLAGVLLLIVLSWQVVMWMLSSDGSEAMIQSVRTLVKYAFVTFLLSTWLSSVGGFFQSNVNDIAAKISGTNAIETATAQLFSSAKKLFSATKAKDTTPCVNISDSTSIEFGTGEYACPDPSTGKGAEPSWIDLLIHFPMVLFTVILKILTMGFMILLLAAFILAIFMAEVLFGLALTLGPILVPWLIWERTESFFDAWLKFMVSACMTKIVAFFMVGVTAGLVTAIKTTADAMIPASAVDYLAIQEMAALICCVVAAVGAFMMWQVQSIAGSLVGGGSGASSKNFGKAQLGGSLRNAGLKLASAPGLRNDFKSGSDGKKGGDKK